MREGDRNTPFFHRIASGRRRRNAIDEISDGGGVDYTEECDVRRVSVEYFSSVFTAKDALNMEDMLGAVELRTTKEMRNAFALPFTDDEVKQALAQMHPTKAPGSDGMLALFFQKFWSIVGQSVVHSVLDVLNHGPDPSCLNYTHIALIPKIKKPLMPSDFRPIILCNVVFKLITKTIANRLKCHLPSIILHNLLLFRGG